MKVIVAMLALAATVVALGVIVLVELIQRLLPLLVLAAIGYGVYMVVRSRRKSQSPHEDPLITAWAQSPPPHPIQPPVSASPTHQEEPPAVDSGYLKWTTPALPPEPTAELQPQLGRRRPQSRP